VRTYRQLFAVAEFRVLFLTQCLVVGGASVSGLALGTTTYASTGSPVLTALALFGGPLVRLVASWFLLAGSDLLRPRQALLLVAGVSAASDLLQAVPGLPWGVRFVLLALPWLAMSITAGSMLALVSDILPGGGYVFGRATMNIAVGGMQIVGYGLAGLLLGSLGTSELFLLAGAASIVAAALIRLGVRDHPPRAVDAAPLRRSSRINRQLLASPVVRPVLLSLWVPNGLVVGCEALFVPFAGRAAGYLYAAAAAGMLLGDVVIGRFVPPAVRDRLAGPLRVLLAAPYLLFLLRPPLPVAAALAVIASMGYAASLPLQERLIAHTEPGVRGQVLGLFGTGLTGMQGIGSVLAGALAATLGAGPAAAATAICGMAIASLAVNVLLIPGLRRSRPAVPAAVSPGAPQPER
jgi:MFS family permease